MKGFKAFYKGMICKGKSLCGEYEKQYAENTEYEESAAVICEKGMHFCKNPLDVFNFYPMIDDNGDFTEFAEVEALDKTETDDNKKFCTKKLKIGAKIDFMDYIKGAFKITYENIKSEVVEATKDIENNGGGSTLAGGDRSTLAGGGGSTLAGGDGSTLAGGYRSTLAGGYGSTLAGGDRSTLAGGDRSTLAGGDRSVLVGDKGSRAKGGKGSVIMLVQRDLEGNIISFKAEQVDGIRIKENVWYKLENGEFKEI